MKNHIIPSGLALITVLMVGCASSSVTPTKSGAISLTENNTSVFLVTPEDGSYGDHTYAGSGEAVATAFERALDKHGMHVVRSSNPVTLNDLFAQASAKGCQYLVIPNVAHWEDRATEWSGKADKISVSVQVYNVEDQQQISNAEIAGRSSWFSLGGDHPEDLIQEPVDEYIGKLIQ